MIGIDTNVLVRYLTGDHPVQFESARHLLEEVCTEKNPGHISVVVLCELAWVLGELNRAAGCDTTWTIDRKAGALPDFDLLQD